MNTFDRILVRIAAISVLTWVLWSFLGGPTWLGLLINANQRAAALEQQVVELQKKLEEGKAPVTK